jgi:superfamily II DNA/RNA helicase
LVKQRLTFPDVKDPKPLFYQFNESEDQVFTRTIGRLTREFAYARYRPLTYFTGDINENELTAQRNLATFMKILLVKRLESSFHAFRSSIGRFIQSYERFLATFRSGWVYISKKYTAKVFDLLDDGDLEGVERLLDEEKADRFEASSFTEKFAIDLESDLSLLKAVRADWQSVTRDPKWEALGSALEASGGLNGSSNGNKLILFTESKETAEYLVGRMTAELGEKALLFTGQSNQEARKQVIQNFDARAYHPVDDYDVLVTTDTLSEGVNLQRSNTVINYDIPWNPTRMIQRVGRVNRVDTPFDAVYTYNFFPTEQSNDLIKLKESAEAKIQAFIEMLGADARLLTEGEEIKSHDLFQQLLSKRTITGEDEDEQSEMEYLKIIRDVRDKQPELFDRIKRLPRKARSAKGQAQAGTALLTYFRRGALEKFFVAKVSNGHAAEVDFFTAAKLMQCRADEKRLPLGGDFYGLLDKNKEAFVLSTSDAPDAEGPGTGARDNGAKILRRLRSNDVRRFRGFTDEDEEFIRAVARLLEDGALPRPTAKKVWEGIRDEINPLKILGVLCRDITPRFFHETRAQQTRTARNPREVILSSYLVGQ